MGIEITVKAKIPYRGSLEDLETFIASAREHGFQGFTWTAYNGDQRDPAELTLQSSREG